MEVELTSEKQYRINKIIESKLDYPFNLKAVRDEDHIDELASKIQEVISSNEFKKNNTVLAIPNNMVVVKKYPYEANFSNEEIINQVDWEVKQFSYSSEDEYIIDFGKIKSSRFKDDQQLLVVAVRESVISYIKKVFSKAKIKLKIVDTDVFAIIRAINVNYECRDSDISALINIENEIVHFIIIDGGDYFMSNQVPLILKPDISDIAKSESIIKVVTKELRKIILENKLGNKIEDLSRVFLFGDLILDNVLESLQDTYNVRIDRANPFRRLRFAPNVSVDEYIWSRPETFTTCVGCALR